LLQQGHDVVFVDRPENVEKVLKAGLEVVFPDGREIHIHRISVVATIEEALTMGPYEAAIFAVKGYDTDRVLKYLGKYQVALPAFISFQNGIGNEARLVHVFGPEKVIPGVMTTSVRREAPGKAVVLHERGVGLSGRHTLISAILAVFNQAGIKAKYYRNPANMKWSKLVLNLMTNASCAILKMTPLEIITDPELRRVEVLAVQEAFRVMREQNFRLVNLPAYPMRWLSLIMREGVPAGLRDPILIRMVANAWGDRMPLLAHDLRYDRFDSEVERINGEVVRHAIQSGIEVPVNQALHAMLTRIVKRIEDPAKYDHNKEAYLAAIYKNSKDR
jgi:2-dehydropantoate 2-reductase